MVSVRVSSELWFLWSLKKKRVRLSSDISHASRKWLATTFCSYLSRFLFSRIISFPVEHGEMFL